MLLEILAGCILSIVIVFGGLCLIGIMYVNLLILKMLFEKDAYH